MEVSHSGVWRGQGGVRSSNWRGNGKEILPSRPPLPSPTPDSRLSSLSAAAPTGPVPVPVPDSQTSLVLSTHGTCPIAGGCVRVRAQHGLDRWDTTSQPKELWRLQTGDWSSTFLRRRAGGCPRTEVNYSVRCRARRNLGIMSVSST